jgi:hypothetical protein
VTTDGTPEELEAAELMREIEDGARERRVAGEHDPGLDRELEESFARVVGNRPGDEVLTHALWSVEASAHVSADAGLGETTDPAKRFAKRVLAKLVRWYMLRITSQVTTFANSTASALRLLSDRVEALSEEVAAVRPPLLPGRVALASRAPSPLELDDRLVQFATDRLKGAQGRVLHADCGSGQIVGLLVRAGADAYGVDPAGALVDAPVAPGLDLVQAEVIGHLRSVSAHGLGGVLLSGSVDSLATGDARLLAFLLGTRVAPGGVVVLVGTHPHSWERDATPLERDLAPGRPLYPETWCHLLAEQGATGLETEGDSESYAVVGTMR